jgi:uncharacterized protein
VARIEVKKDDLVKIMEETVRSRVAGYLREMGYYHITVDLEGYETGSMNRELALKSPRNSQTA